MATRKLCCLQVRFLLFCYRGRTGMLRRPDETAGYEEPSELCLPAHEPKSRKAAVPMRQPRAACRWAPSGESIAEYRQVHSPTHSALYSPWDVERCVREAAAVLRP